MIRRPPRSTHCISSAASDVYKRQLMNSLMDILMRFRQWKVAFMCDIKAFFHQIRVHPDDADLFRFFWFKDRSLREAILNLFLSHVFGSQSSSFVTGFTVRKHAEVIRPRYPYNVYDLIRYGFYVDDGSGGGDLVDEALELKVNAVAAMAEGGMELVKCCLLYTSPSPRDKRQSRMPSSA